MKKIALLVYPEFSLQEVMNLSRLFRWDFDRLTEVIATSPAPVTSEEGIQVLPRKTTDEFRLDDYDCLILPGCSDYTEVVKDKKIIDFLHAFKGNTDFPIGAICSAPLFLARAGLLEHKPFTASLFMECFDFCPFLERDQYVAAPLVVSGNLVTAGGNNFNGFAVAMAHLLGLDCPDHIFSGYMDDWTPDDYDIHLPPEAVEELAALFADF